MAQACEWLSFDEAGNLIDGPDGWRVASDGARASAVALLMYAQRGVIALQSQEWNVVRGRNTDPVLPPAQPADSEAKAELLLMLVAREKSKQDSSKTSLPGNVSLIAAFSLADEVRGNYEALRTLYDHASGSFRYSCFSLIGLRFNRADICSAFLCAPPPIEAPAANSRGRAMAQRECEELLRQMMATAPPQMKKAAFQSEAMKSIKGLSGKAFTRAWGNVAPEFDRDKPGAPPGLRKRIDSAT